MLDWAPSVIAPPRSRPLRCAARARRCWPRGRRCATGSASASARGPRRPPARSGCTARAWARSAPRRVSSTRSRARGVAGRRVDLDARGPRPAAAHAPRRCRAASRPLDHPWCVGRRPAPRAGRAAGARRDGALAELDPRRARARHPAASSSRDASRTAASPATGALGALVRARARARSPRSARAAAADAERFVALGAPRDRVEVTGDLKLDPPRRAARAGARARRSARRACRSSSRAAPTRARRRRPLAALAAARAAGPRRGALVLAPRHPERFEAVARCVRARGLPLRRRSRLEPRAARARARCCCSTASASSPALYARAARRLRRRLAGRRAADTTWSSPRWRGRAPLFGPHTENIREVAELLLAADGARRVADAARARARCVECAARSGARGGARRARAAARARAPPRRDGAQRRAARARARARRRAR